MITGALLCLAASSVAISAASSVGHIRTMKLTGVVIGKIAKEGQQADRVAGPMKVDLQSGGKVVGTPDLHRQERPGRGPRVQRFAVPQLCRNSEAEAPSPGAEFSLIFGGPTNSNPNAPGGGDLSNDQNFPTGTIAVKTGFKQFAKAHGRFTVALQLNKFAK